MYVKSFLSSEPPNLLVKHGNHGDHYSPPGPLACAVLWELFTASMAAVP